MSSPEFWDQVLEGDKPPDVVLPISMKTLVLNTMGTRDVMPYHHNREYTKSVGIRDAFVNTSFNLALFSRWVTDWSGPSANFRSVSLRMVDQLCPGDVSTTSGSVLRKWAEGEDALLELDATISAEAGAVAHLSGIIAVPAEGRPLRDVPPLDPDFGLDPDPHMPPSAMETIGVEGPRRPGPYPVSEAQIGYWCEMVRDANPAYSDGGAGATGGIVAPALSYRGWALPRFSQFGVDPERPDIDLPDQESWPCVNSEAEDEYIPPGASQIIVQRLDVELGAAIRPGDLISFSTELGNCSALKRTKLGLGYFVTRLQRFYNQDRAIVAKAKQTILRYGVPEDFQPS